MMKKISRQGVSLALVLIMLISMIPAFATNVVANGSCGANLQYSIYQLTDGTHKLVITGSGNMSHYDYNDYAPWYSFRETISEVDFPDEITSIGNYAFYNCTNLANTELPDKIESIGQQAFQGCANLNLAKLPDMLVTIKDQAFKGCTSLTLTKLPIGIKIIGNSTFSGCTNLALSELPSGVTDIGYEAFKQCTSLALTELPNGLTNIWTYAFSGCTNLALTELPDGITNILSGTFNGCTNLALTELPNGVTSIEMTAFRNCTNLALTELPNGVTNIGTAAFDGCTNLALTELPNGAINIDSAAFRNCTSLALSNLPSGLTSIKAETFKGCTALTLAELPSGLTSIGDSAFYGCTNLTLKQVPSGCSMNGQSAFNKAGWSCDAKIYTENEDGVGYTQIDTVTLHGIVGGEINLTHEDIPNYDHYTLNTTTSEVATLTPSYEVIEITLYYDRDTYTVSLDPNMGTVTPESKTVLFGTTYGALPVPTRDGFDFDGWYTDLESGDKVVADTSIQNQNHILYAHWLIPEGGTVGGIVVDEGGYPVPNAKVTIRAGTVDYKVTYTDALGRFSMSSVEYGIYNLVAEKNDVVTTAIIHVAESNQDYTLVMPAGQTNSILIVEPGSPEIVVGGLDALYENEEFYPAEEQAVVAAGGNVVVTMTVAEKSETDLAEEAQKIRAVAGTDEIVLYLDMSVVKSTTSSGGDQDSQDLKELPHLLQIIVPLSAEMQGKQGYTVYRIHEGEVDTIKDAPNEAGEYLVVNGNNLEIYANKFSVYSLAYQQQTSVSNGNSSSGSSGGTYNPGPHFEDVLPPDWFYEDVMDAVKKGYMEGITKTKFCPNDPFTRAQAAYASATLQGAKPDSFDQRFEDVTPDTGYAKAIIWADDAGVAIGYGNGCFGPTDGITREQMALILYRQFGDNTNHAWLEDDYTDADEISEWAMDAVRWAVACGLLKGNELGELLPQGGITRAEAAAMFSRL